MIHVRLQQKTVGDIHNNARLFFHTFYSHRRTKVCLYVLFGCNKDNYIRNKKSPFKKKSVFF